jgi:response regulator RpfG family c-di-GMP phosphodiesterase
MTKVMIVESDHNQRHLYSMILENLNPSVEILEVETVADAIAKLEEEQVDIVISEFSINDENCQKIYQFINYKELPILFIVATNDDFSLLMNDESFMNNESFLILEKPITEPMLRDAVDGYMDFDIQTSFDPEDITDNFCKIKIYYFLRFDRTDIPVYLKLSNRKYVKLFHGEYEFGSEEIHRYLARGVEYLYITKEDFEHFKVTIGNTPFLSILDSKEENPQERWKRTQEVLSSLLMSCGITERALNKGFNNIESIKDRISNSDDYDEILSIITTNESFYSDHSLLTAIFSGLILEKVEWNTEANLEKLLLASLLHDATLDPEVANVMESNNMDLISEMSKEDQEKYFSHTKEVADLIQQNDAIHKEVGTIVLEHHERPDGTGFPRGLTSRHIHPLSSLFIFAHDLVEQLYANDFDPSKMNQIMNYLGDKYNECHFESAYSAFLEVFTPKVDSPVVEEESQDLEDLLEESFEEIA